MVQTDIQEPVEVLEQRAPKVKSAQIVAEGAAESGLSEPEAIQTNGHAPESVPGIYLVRVPKPPIDETALKATQAEFQAHVDKLKKFNTVLSKKREEIRELRKQMGEARSLKETAEPEYQEKLTRIKQLRDLRETYLNRIKEIKGNLQGLECKSEEELDAKIRELENKISHEGMSLREEKQAVQQISKLASQRPRIKEYDLHKSSLVELEAEAQKIKSIIADMDTEFNVIKTERNAASGIKKDIYGKLDKVNAELKELEAEHNEAVKAKNDALEQLSKIRAEMDTSLAEYRENRKLSLEVRDLVAAGRIDEARERASAQVAEVIAKISSDSAYRKEYQHLWAQQRRFAVSDLLPESSVQAQQAAATKPGAKGVPGKGGKAAPGAKAPPPKPNGKEKAASIIESLMAQASKEVEALQSRRAAQQAAEDRDEVEVAPKAAKAPKAEPTASTSSTVTPIPGRLVTDPAAAAASAFNFKVELPKVDDLDFTPLPLPRSSDQEQSPESKRATLLEEQRAKAAEAEERKKRRAEQAERRRAQAGETARRLEQERKERDAAARAAAAQAKAAAARAPADDSANDSPATAAAKAEAAANKPSIPTNFEKTQAFAAAKRPKSKAPAPLRTATKVWQQYQAWIIFAAVMLLTIIIAVAYMFSS